MKKPYSFRLDPDLIEKVRALGDKDNRKLTPMIENILITFVKENEKHGNNSDKIDKKRYNKARTKPHVFD